MIKVYKVFFKTWGRALGGDLVLHEQKLAHTVGRNAHEAAERVRSVNMGSLPAEILSVEPLFELVGVWGLPVYPQEEQLAGTDSNPSPDSKTESEG